MNSEMLLGAALLFGIPALFGVRRAIQNSEAILLKVKRHCSFVIALVIADMLLAVVAGLLVGLGLSVIGTALETVAKVAFLLVLIYVPYSTTAGLLLMLSRRHAAIGLSIFLRSLIPIALLLLIALVFKDIPSKPSPTETSLGF